MHQKSKPTLPQSCTVQEAWIEVGQFEARRPIGEWRLPIARSGGRSAGLRERSLTMSAAILANVGFILALALDLGGMTRGGDRAPRTSGSMLAEVYLLTPAIASYPIQHHIPRSIRKIRITVPPLNVPRIDADPSLGGSIAWSTPVATAISAGSLETERARLRSLYRERIEEHLGQYLPQSASGGTESCSLRVLQDVNGRILEVAVTDCVESSGSQQQLLADIRKAAPLPAPPRPDLFTPQLLVRIGKSVNVEL